MPEHEARAKFETTQTILADLGYHPVNPFDVPPYKDNPTWEDYMAADIRALMDCNAIYMQCDWGQSKGARIEYQIALELGLVVMFEGQFN